MFDEYSNIIEDILDNKEFNKLKAEKHHGTNRLIHSKRVSYYAYKTCKLLRLDYKAAARAGLLHDFFIYEKDITRLDKFKLIFTHPKHAFKNSKKHFDINEKEQDIILSHMFPININLPKFIESWIVSTIDKIVATYEFGESFYLKNMYVPNLYLLLIIKIFN